MKQMRNALLLSLALLAFLSGCATGDSTGQSAPAPGHGEEIAETGLEAAAPAPLLEPVIVEGRSAVSYGDAVYFTSPNTLYGSLRRDGAICMLGDNGVEMIYPRGAPAGQRTLFILDDFIYTGSRRISLDGTHVGELFGGNIVYVDTANKFLYYIVRGEEESGLFRYSIEENARTHLFSGAYCEYLTYRQGSIYFYESGYGQCDLYRIGPDGSDLELIASDQCGTEGDWLTIPGFRLEDGQIFYSVGTFQGSGGYFYGEDYRMDLDGRNKVSLAVEEDSDAMRTSSAFSIQPAAGDPPQIERSPEELGLAAYMDQEDDYIYYYKNTEVLGDWLYFQAEAWGYRPGSGWRDFFLAGGVYRLNPSTGEVETLDFYVADFDEDFPY